jgi:hypothetical protein
MTRILSQLLGATEPAFRLGLKQLEQASGGTAEDIRLTAEIVYNMQDRLRRLGLDPQDTTGRELYAALMQRIREDSEAFQELLGIDQHDTGTMARIERFIAGLDIPKEVFALKNSAAKKILRKHPPKKAMKQLGYRSVESMLKHEQVCILFAAAYITETAVWHRAIQTAYKKLSSNDFECRPVQVVAPDNSRWDKLSATYVLHTKHNIIAFRELGAVVLLPMPSVVQAAPLAATLLTLQAITDIRTSSTYLKLHQVQPDFGSVVAAIARNEPVTKAEIAGSLLPWKLVHRYFSRHPDAYKADLFEPHVHQEDLHWQPAEDILATVLPRFAFWQGAAHLGLLAQDTGRASTQKNQRAGEIVSLNLIDSVLNFCNMLPYERRFVRYARDHIWHELMLRYMHQDNIEQTIHQQLSNELIGEQTA